MKKAHELSVLCGLKINISFFDANKNIVTEFTSDPDFTFRHLISTLDAASHICRQNLKIRHKFISPGQLCDKNG